MKVYFDNNATTPLSNKVKFFIRQYLDQNNPLNASSVHFYGRSGKGIINEAKNKILRSIFPSTYRKYGVIFVSSGTEANNQIINCFNPFVVVGSTEHVSVIEPAKSVKSAFISCDNSGLLRYGDISSLILDITKSNGINKSYKIDDVSIGKGNLCNDKHYGCDVLVSVGIANSETGIIQDIASVADIAHKSGAFFHCDFIQGIGKVDFNFEDCNLDYLTISGHKIGALQGIAALLYKLDAPFPKPLLLGGGQQRGLRSGTESPLLSMCLGIAVEDAINNITERILHFRSMQDLLESKIYSYGGSVIGNTLNRLPNTSLVLMPNVSGETQLINFDLNDFIISRGSACSSGVYKKSTAAIAMGVDDLIWNNCIRVSFGLQNSIKEVNAFCDAWYKLYN